MSSKDEALKMAIEWMEKVASFTPPEYDKEGIEVAKALYEALEQPAQEPVACTNKYGCKCDKHYTHPHQWQGLTDDEAKKIIAEFEPLYDGYGMLCAIEQALKDKNT